MPHCGTLSRKDVWKTRTTILHGVTVAHPCNRVSCSTQVPSSMLRPATPRRATPRTVSRGHALCGPSLSPSRGPSAPALLAKLFTQQGSRLEFRELSIENTARDFISFPQTSNTPWSGASAQRGGVGRAGRGELQTEWWAWSGGAQRGAQRLVHTTLCGESRRETHEPRGWGGVRGGDRQDIRLCLFSCNPPSSARCWESSDNVLEKYRLPEMNVQNDRATFVTLHVCTLALAERA